MPHKEADADTREYRLGLWYREMTKLEETITQAEQRSQRMTMAHNPPNERFPSMNTVR